MELKEGMYVRTEDGEISKIEWFTLQIWEGDNTTEANFWLENKQRLMYPLDKFKASHNIIDLIEVGDYVNGRKVTLKTDNDYIEVDYGENIDGYHNKDIKSIVTKEQFESICYKVEE